MTEYKLSFLLSQKSINYIFDIFEDESIEICLVGGCVRDALLGKTTRDIDIAVNITPDKVLQILKKNNLVYEDYAYKYGSISVYFENQKFQITSLRKDFNQIGRHTNIVFTQNWEEDASRRDFTINAIYLSRNGKLKDFFNGKADLFSGTIRFIGNIENSIQEDFLRIFRYYRFLGAFENPILIEEYDKILLNYFKYSFDFLSNDLIYKEILKMFDVSFPLNCFFNDKKNLKRKEWIKLVEKHFLQSDYEIGLNKCLNKIDLLIN